MLQKKVKFLEGNYRKLYVEIYDKDGWFSGDDPLGHCEIDWWNCIKGSGRWKINNIFPLKGPAELRKEKENKGATFGEIYLQVMFLKENETNIKAEPPKLIEDLKATLEA